MSYVSLLNLRDSVSVIRTTVGSDGYGGGSAATAITVLGKAAIWSLGGRESWISDQMMAISSHVLACRTTDDVAHEDTVTYDSQTYQVTGHADDIMNMGIVKIVPLKLVN